MINKISSWASGLIVAVIIGTIMEMILPDNKNKKYVKVVIGLFIIYTIMAPIIGELDNVNINIESILSEFTDTSQIDTIPTNTDLSFEQTYKQNIETDIISKLKEKGYSVSKINTEINFENDDNYGTINSISLKLKHIKGEISGIKDIEISVEIGELNNNVGENSEEIEIIKDYLNENYGILTQNIYIQLA